MKILITGATGFIGAHLIDRLVAEKHQVSALVRPSSNSTLLQERNISIHTDTGNTEELKQLLKTECFDGIIHLASLYLTQHRTDQVIELVNSNVVFPASLLEAAVESETPWFINTGTFWQHYQNKSYSPVNLYAATKQAFQDIAAFYVEARSYNFVTIQLSDTYGPGDTRPKIFNLWSRAANEKETLDMSPGAQQVDISHVDDVTAAFLRLIVLLEKDQQKKLRGKVFAVSSGKALPLQKLSKIFEKATGEKLSINWGKRDYRPREVMIPWNKGKTVPGWRPTVSLLKGIKETFKF